MKKIFLLALAVLGLAMTGCETDDGAMDSRGMEVSSAETHTWMNVGGHLYETTITHPEGVVMEMPDDIITECLKPSVCDATLSPKSDVVAEREETPYIYRTFKSKINLQLQDFSIPVYFLQERAFLKLADGVEHPFPYPQPEYSVETERHPLGEVMIDQRIYSRAELLLKARISTGKNANPVVSSTKCTTLWYTHIIIDDSVDEIIDSLVISL